MALPGGTGETCQPFRGAGLTASSVRVIHGAVPALAWRVELGGKSIVFSGDTNGDDGGLVILAGGADRFVAHNAVPEGAREWSVTCTCRRR